MDAYMTQGMRKFLAAFIISIVMSFPVVLAVQINENSIQVTNLDEDSATISWTTDINANGFVDYGSSVSNMNTVPETGGMTSYHLVNLENLNQGVRYFFKVRSGDGYVDEDESEFHEFTTLISAPTNLVANEVGHDDAVLKWSGVQGASKYRVFVNDQIKAEPTSSQATIEGLSENTTYNAYIRAVDSSGRMSAKSNEIAFSTTKQPYEISFIDVTGITNTSATITWDTDRTVKSIVKYGVNLNLEQTKENPELKTSHSISLDGLKPQTKYFYAIVAGSTESQTMDFNTYASDAVGKLVISDIELSSISAGSAIIRWRTSMAADSEVNYGTDDKLRLSEGSSSAVEEHMVMLDDLLPMKKYYFKVSSGDVSSPMQSFTTAGSSENFLQIDALPELTSQATINVSGATRVNARVYIYTNNDQNAQVRETINGTRFSFPVTLSSMALNENRYGLNLIRVESWDQAGNKDTKTAYVDLDAHAPILEIEGLPDMTNQPFAIINGVSEKGASISVFLDNISQQGITSLTSANFTHKINLGRTGTTVVKIVATDNAGNERVYEKSVKIDKDVPRLEYENEFGKETHFKLFRIKGTTKPDSEISVVNWGKYSGCKQAYLDLDYTSCEQFLDYYGASYQLDPVSYALGMNVSTKSDSDGEFDLIVSLVRDETLKGDLKGYTNNLEITVVDKAGNSYREMKKIVYKPGCSDWVAGEIQSYPFNIYTKDIHASDVSGSAFFPVRYLGPGVPEVREVTVFKDKAEHGIDLMEDIDRPSIFKGVSQSNDLVETDMQNSNKYLKLGKPKATPYMQESNSFSVYAPITISQYRGSIETYPDELFAYMGVRILYDSEGGKGGSCEIYPVVSFDVQKPEDISSWLSPEQINNTIQALGQMIEYTEELVEVVKKASYFALIACGAMVAWQYVKGFGSKFSDEKDENGCTSQDNDMERVYMVCDRVLCPSSPPQCNNFEPLTGNAFGLQKPGEDVEYVSADEYEKQIEINNAYRKEYDDLEAEGKGTFEQWAESCSRTDPPANNCPDVGKYKTITYPTYSTTIPETKDNKKITMYMQVLEIDRDGKVVNPNSVKVTGGDGKTINVNIIQRELNTAAAKCRGSGGTLIVTNRETQSGGNTIGTLRGVNIEDIRQSEAICGESPQQLMSSNDFNAGNGNIKPTKVVGCYNPDCPTFDNTKCPNEPWSVFTGGGGTGKPGINPAEGLWSSLRCGCVPALLKHLENYLTIMRGAKKCLEQAQIGEIRGGLCERLLAQFICDLLIEAFKLLLSSFGSDGTTDGADVGGAGAVRSGISNYKENSKAIGKNLGDRYSGLVNERMGLNSNQLVHKACMFGITGDWSLLDGVMENYIDSVDVAPVYTMLGESRPYGYDPFTGKMTISYNIYVGVVPGGETDVRVVLECDPDAPGGDYCGLEAPQIEVVNRHLSSNSPALNQDFVKVDNNAVYWYNKAVMYLNFKVGNEPKSVTLEKEIWRKGDLAYNCYFSLLGGIHCPISTSFGSGNGLVELKGFGKGSDILPKQTTVYRPGNVVPALVQLHNRYTDDYFFVRFDWPGMTKAGGIEYQIPGSGQAAENENVVDYYYFYADKVEEIQSTSEATTNQLNQFVITPDFSVNEDGYLGKFSMKLEGIYSAKGTFECKDKVKNEIIVQAKDFEVNQKNMGDLDCFSADDERKTYNSEKNIVVSKITITSRETSLNGVESKDPGILSLCDAKKKTDCIKTNIFSVGDAPTVSTSTRKIEMNVLEDTGTGHGDTPILYDTGNSQLTEVTYRVMKSTDRNSANQAPIVDIIEPLGSYWTKSEGGVIGLNIWDDHNIEFERMRITIEGVGQDNKDVKCEWVLPSDDPDYGPDFAINNNCPFFYAKSGTRGDFFGHNSGNELPFFEFFLDWSNERPTDKDENAMYDVTVTVTDKGKPKAAGEGEGFKEGTQKTSNPATKRFRILQDDKIRRDLLMLKIGCPVCSGHKSITYQDTTQPVAKANSTTPRTDVRN